MSRISRLVVIVTALTSLYAALSPTAGAVTWTNDGSTVFTATGGQGTLTSGGNPISCTGGDASGSAPASSTSTTYSISGTILFTGCTTAGIPSTIECNYVLTATTLVSSIVTGNVDSTCALYVSSTKLCHIFVFAHGQYRNHPVPGTLVMTTTDLAGVTGVNCPVAGGGHRTQLDFQTTSAAPPTITRAA